MLHVLFNGPCLSGALNSALSHKITVSMTICLFSKSTCVHVNEFFWPLTRYGTLCIFNHKQTLPCLLLSMKYSLGASNSNIFMKLFINLWF